MSRKLTVPEIMAFLPSLTRGERNQIKLAINMLDGSEVLGDTNKELFYEVIKKFFIDHGLGDIPIHSQLSRTIGANTLDNAIEAVESFIRLYNINLDRASRIQFYKMLCDLSFEYMKEIKKTPSFRNMITILHNIGPLIEENFPGYAQSNMFEFVVRQRLRNPPQKGEE